MIGFYLFCGILFALLVPLAFHWDRTEKKKKKRGIPDEKKRGCCLGRSMVLLALIFMGPVFLFLAVGLSFDVIDEWKSYRILREKGEFQQAPLIEIEEPQSKGCIVTYEYGNAKHRDVIDQTRCKALQDKDSVTILAYGNTSRVAGTEADYEILTAIPFLATTGLLVTGAILVHFFKRLRDRFDRIKRKNG